MRSALIDLHTGLFKYGFSNKITQDFPRAESNEVSALVFILVILLLWADWIVEVLGSKRLQCFIVGGRLCMFKHSEINLN